MAAHVVGRGVRRRGQLLVRVGEERLRLVELPHLQQAHAEAVLRGDRAGIGSGPRST